MRFTDGAVLDTSHGAGVCATLVIYQRVRAVAIIAIEQPHRAVRETECDIFHILGIFTTHDILICVSIIS